MIAVTAEQRKSTLSGLRRFHSKTFFKALNIHTFELFMFSFLVFILIK